MSVGWQWFWAIIGGVAFLMAAPSFLQLLFGQPKIGLAFGEDATGTEGKLLLVHVQNIPITDRILRMMRVTRLSAQDLFITIDVFNFEGNKITDFVPAIKTSPYDKSGRVNLAGSDMVANVNIARWQRTKKALVLQNQTETILPEGVYKIKVGYGLEGRSTYFKHYALLKVGKSEEEAMWDKGIKDIIFTK